MKSEEAKERVAYYRMTNEQHRGITRIKQMARTMIRVDEMTDEDKGRLSEVMVRFWITILDHDIKDQASQSG